MNRSAVRISIAGTLFVLLLWGALIVFNRSHGALGQGELLTESSLSRIHRLEGWEQKKDGYYLTIHVENPSKNYSLLMGGLSKVDPLRCNDRWVEPTGHFNSVFLLPQLGDEENTYHLFVEQLGEYSVFLAESEVMSQGLLAQKLTNCAMLSIMAIMPVYTLSLFLFKKSESYLLYFFAYQCVLFGWGVIRLSPDLIRLLPGWLKISYIFVWLVSMMSLKYCVDAAEISSPKWLKSWTSWHRMALIAIGIGMIMYPLSNIRREMNTLVYYLCVLVAGNAVSRKIKGAGWLFVGSILRVGLAPIIYLGTFRDMLGQECFVYFLLHRTYLIDLPFLLGGMLFINQKFAHQFSESERLAIHLDELVAVRTRELETAHAERQSMILNITHDLRTPLFVMKNCLGIVEENPNSLPDMLPVMKERSEFVSSLTEDLFLLVKLQEGKLMLNQQRENLSELLQELCAWMMVEAEKQEIRVTEQILPEKYVWGDRVRLQQIFQNLLTNAIHYTPKGGEISLRMEVMSAEDRAEEITEWICVTIRDSGKGISPADAEHIFDRYFHTKADNKHDSSGLGLSIAKELTLLHHGTIDFTSEEGQGTEFCVTLPLC